MSVSEFALAISINLSIFFSPTYKFAPQLSFRRNMA